MVAVTLAASLFHHEVGTAWATIAGADGVQKCLRYPEDRQEGLNYLDAGAKEGTEVRLGNDKISVELRWRRGRWILESFRNEASGQKLVVGKPVLTVWDKAKRPVSDLERDTMPSISIEQNAVKGGPDGVRYGVVVKLSRFRSCDDVQRAAAATFFLGDGENQIEELVLAMAYSFGDPTEDLGRIDAGLPKTGGKGFSFAAEAIDGASPTYGEGRVSFPQDNIAGRGKIVWRVL